MNIVAAVFLLFMEEEEAFFMLCAVIQQVPEYYVAEMIGRSDLLTLRCG